MKQGGGMKCTNSPHFSSAGVVLVELFACAWM